MIKTRTFYLNLLLAVSLALAVGLLLIPVSPALAQGPTCTVSSSADSGAGSLRQCLADVASGGTVDFAAGLAGQTITLTSGSLTINKNLTIDGSSLASSVTISGNSSVRVFSINATTTVTLKSLTIANGSAPSGGGIDNFGTLTVTNSTFTGNSATGGGGINNFGTLTVTNSTFTGNSATSGGGIGNYGTLTVTNSTFTGNSGATSGGGIDNYGTVVMANTILANASSGDDYSGISCPVTNTHNLVESGNACGWFLVSDPQLGALGDYGGSTETIPLLPGSSAIDAGNDTTCPAIDQRGITRPVGAACDIGAFESRGFSLTLGGGSEQSALINTVFAQPLTLTVTSAYSEPVDGGVVTFTGPGSGAGINPAGYKATISGGPSASSGQVTQVVTANNTAGSYVVTATTPGNLGSAVSYNLTNAIPPTLTAHNPLTNAITAPLAGSVILTYSADISAATVTSRTVAIHSMMHGLITETHSVNGNVITVDPSRNFFPGELVYASATTRTTDLYGTHPLSSTVWQFTTAAGAGPGEFPLTHTVTTTAAGANSVGAADVDGDGDIDLLSASIYDDKIAWYENDGSGSFTTAHIVTTAADGAYSVGAADVDGDGDIDLLSASWWDNKIAWYENDGGGAGFTAHTVTTAANAAHSVGAADVDRDGDLDLLSASANDGKIAWYENDGATDPTFTAHTVTTTAAGAMSVGAADVDGDGDIDLLSASASGSDYKIAWYENDGAADPTFTDHTVTTAVAGATSVGAADVDGDGDIDLLSASTWGGGEHKIAWYENDGAADPSFTAHTVTLAAYGAQSVGAADVDGDGDIDLLSAALNIDQIAWYENDGAADPSFTLHPVTTAADGAKSVGAADVDGDGDLDLFSASGNDNKIAWYENVVLPDVALVKTVSPTTAKPGDSITYTLTFSNVGPGIATGVVITDSVPVSVTGVSVISRGVTITPTGAAPNFVWQVQDLAVTEGGVITLTGTLAEPLAAGVFTNTATITATNDSDAANNSGSAAISNCSNAITVQNTADSGAGSLRQALLDVCSGGTINFAAGLSGQTITLTSTELSITNTVTITNPNAPGLAVSGNNARRVFNIQSSGVVTLSNFSVISGTTPIGGSSCPTYCGGGIYNAGTLTVQNSTLAGNSATQGGGINNAGTLTVQTSAFSGNSATSSGGGLFNNGDYSTLTNVTFSDNSATNNGGGLYNQDGSATLTNVTFSGNSASNAGGGLYNYTSSPTLTNVTFSGNSAHAGGGLYNIFSSNPQVRNSIMWGNSGGEIYNDYLGDATVSDSVVQGGYSGGSNIITADPLLGTLGDNTLSGTGGGATETLPLLPGSAALDAANASTCPATDQRGVARPQGNGCDLGAFESRGFSLTLGGGSEQSTLINTVFAQPLTLTVTSAFTEPVDGGQVVFTGPGSGAGTNPAIYTATISGSTVTQVVTANNTAGSYVVTATTPGNLGSALSYTLTNVIPEMAVIGHGLTINAGDATPSTTDDTDFGSAVILGGIVTHTFTISNSGAYSLTLTGSPVVSITGPAAGDFSVTAQPVATLGPNLTTTFTVRFDPTVLGTRAATVTIANDDSDENPYDFAIAGTGTIPKVQFTQATYQINEAGSAVGPTLSLTRSGQIEGESRVQIAFTDDTATGGGVDYTSTPIIVTFPAGSTAAQTVSVVISQDFLDEATESLTMTVTSLSNAQIGGQGTATLQVLDDDSAGLTVSPTVLTVSEPNTTGVFTLSLTSQPTAAVTVTLTSTATDECTVPATAVIAPVDWQTGVSVTVTAVDDALSDGAQPCTVNGLLSSDDGNYRGQPFNVAVTVQDDDADNKPTTMYLPLVFHNFAVGPDLVIDSLTFGAGGPQVVIRNSGNAPVTTSFWVDVYFNPNQTPTLNLPWQSMAPAGAVWGVTTDILSGDTLILTVGGAYYRADLSSASFPAGVPVYGYVDSVDHTTSYGAVQELDESNNLFGPATSGAGGAAPLSGQGEGPDMASLPQR